MNESKSSQPDSRPKGRKYDLAFKQQAVAQVVDQRRKVKDVARDLGISEFLLYEWRRSLCPPIPEASATNPASRSRQDLETENLALRRELEYVRQQRDILKKTLGILSEPPSSATSGSRR